MHGHAPWHCGFFGKTPQRQNPRRSCPVRHEVFPIVTLAGRQLPDKAVSVLDTACARLSLGQNATPPQIEDATRQLDDLDVQQRVLEREAAVGADHAERLASIAGQKTTVTAELKSLQERRDKETGSRRAIRDVRTKLETAGGPTSRRRRRQRQRRATRSRHRRLCAPISRVSTPSLDTLQGENPLMRVCVDNPNRRRSDFRLDRHPGRQNAAGRNQQPFFR